MRHAAFLTLLVLLPASAVAAAPLSPTPLIEWSHEAQRAIVPPGPGGVFGAENYGTKFPGEAAVYMGIVHAAMYDAVVAIEHGYEPYATRIIAPAGTSPDAAIATAAHHVLIGLQPALGLTPAKQAVLDEHYAAALARIADGPAKDAGVALGEQVASEILRLRANDGRDRNPQLSDLDPPAAGPGVWDPGTAPAVGLRMPGIRPLALTTGGQFRPDGPNALSSSDYASDLREVAELGRAGSATRKPAQTTAAMFWTDHDLRQWNDALLRVAADRGLDLLDTARMLAMTHVAGGDAMIACFDAKYVYWFWRPYQAIPAAGTDGNDATIADTGWKPLASTPNFPEYPSAHACHSSAVTEALASFFSTEDVRLTLDSRITGTTREYARLHDVVRDVDWARVLAGFHFRNSDQEGSTLGRKVARYVTANFFRPTPAVATKDSRASITPQTLRVRR